jgi:hypothetical protein
MKTPGSVALLFFFLFSMLSCNSSSTEKTSALKDSTKTVKKDTPLLEQRKPIDTADFNRRMKALANGDTTGRWPAKMPYPLAGALLPYNRIVAFYGNLYSKKMGILGEIPKDEMFAKLKQECKEWQAADTTIPILPCLHYIAVTAQGAGDKYRLRMPFKQIDTIIKWSNEINAITFLDVQVGWSTVQDEIPRLETYLAMPKVHLAIDPEFSMKFGDKPGKRIGTYNADDINYVIDYLAALVRKNNLPPKILMVHRFTKGMVTDYARIKKVPEVQIIMDMDGWGDRILKRDSYKAYIFKEPVEFAGCKLFYKNDIKKGDHKMFEKDEVLKLTPKPLYIQYQ